MIKRIWVITLFPGYFDALLEGGVAGAALRGERSENPEDRFELNCVNPRNFTPKDFKGVDAGPFGGGAGMVMRADVLKNTFDKGIVEVGGYGENYKDKLHFVYPCPRGSKWDLNVCKEFAKNSLDFSVDKDIVFLCGRYEGVDERFLKNYVDEYISLGDFILTGGELAVMTILDSAIRYVPGILGNKLSAIEESFEDGLLEHPVFTKPREFQGELVPDALLSGHHKKIQEYYHNEKLEMTKKYRPDLFEQYQSKGKK